MMLGGRDWLSSCGPQGGVLLSRTTAVKRCGSQKWLGGRDDWMWCRCLRQRQKEQGPSYMVEGSVLAQDIPRPSSQHKRDFFAPD